MGGSLAAEASGLALTDRNLAMVLGDRVSATTRLWWQEGTGVFRIGALEAQAGDLQLSASGEIGGLAEGFATRGRLRIEAGDLAPLSGYAGRAVSGRGSVTLDGAGSPLGGDFDLRLAVQVKIWRLMFRNSMRRCAAPARFRSRCAAIPKEPPCAALA